MSAISETWSSFCSGWVLIGLGRPKTARTTDLESLLVANFSLRQGWEYRTGVIAQLGLNHCDVPHSANKGAGKQNNVKWKIKKTMFGPKGLIV